MNIAPYRTLEKTGFKRYGHIRDEKMVNTYCDYYLYGIDSIFNSQRGQNPNN